MKLLSNHKLIALLVFGLLYSSAYWGARSNHWLVHRTGYYSVAGHGQKLDGHYISQGNFGSPMLSPISSTLQAVSAFVLWPAAQLELVYWHFATPPGSPWNCQPNPSIKRDAALTRTAPYVKRLTWQTPSARARQQLIPTQICTVTP